jgi:hypothetical protein
MKKLNALHCIFAICLVVSCNQASNDTSKASIDIPNDSIQYETITMVKSFDNCEITDSKCTYTMYSYPQINEANSTLEQAITKIILAHFNCNNFESIDSIQRVLINQYEAYRAAHKQYNQSWNWEKEITIAYQNNRWISLKCTYNAYTGGANTLTELGYITLDKQTGDTLRLTDFISQKSLAKFIRLAETCFRKTFAINPQQSLNEKGFQFPNDSFILPENYLLTNEGLSFYYNKYEIAPGSFGLLSFSIPASQLAPLLFKK